MAPVTAPFWAKSVIISGSDKIKQHQLWVDPIGQLAAPFFVSFFIWDPPSASARPFTADMRDDISRPPTPAQSLLTTLGPSSTSPASRTAMQA